MKRMFPICAVIALMLSCEKTPEEVAVSSVTIGQPTAEMIVGEKLQLSATITPSNATEKNITWASSKHSVATVSNDGWVTAIAEGTSTITASCGGKTGNCQVTVKKGYVEVASVTLNKQSLNLTKGESETLAATVNPSDATDKTVTWNSSSPQIASVDQTGKVTALASGTANITANAGNQTATCLVSVEVLVEKVSLDKSSIDIVVGESTTLVATITPNDATSKTIAWSSSNTAIAEVDQNGKVTAKKGGNAVITAAAGNQSARCDVTVIVPVVSISLDKTTLSLEEEQTATLVATISPNDASDPTIEWSSSDEMVATVNQSGMVTALLEGKAVISAKASDKIAECVLTVTTNPKNIIAFKDANIKQALVNAFDLNGDRELSYNEASLVTDGVQLKNAFGETKTYMSFDEFQFFTGITWIADETFKEWNLSSIVLPIGVEIIGNSAFEGCEKLSSINLPEGVRAIFNYAFKNCYQLSKPIFPDSLIDIGKYAFGGDRNMVGELAFPSSLEYIREYAFYGCTGLTGGLSFPRTISIIGASAFSGCSGLNGQLMLPINPAEGRINLGNYAFEGCSFSGDFVLPLAINLGNNVFQNAEFSGNVYVHITGYYTFYEAVIGGNLIITDDVSEINNSFRHTHVKGYVYLGKNVVKLKSDAFYFAWCTKYYVAAQTPPACDADDAVNLPGRYLGVPIGRKEEYSSARCWKNARIIEEVDFSDLQITP